MYVPDIEQIDWEKGLKLAEINIMSYKVLDELWDYIDFY